MKGVSVIICCYNSASRLPETLRHVALQQVADDIPWEVIVVNNNSTDTTVEVAGYEWNRHECNVPFKIIDEPNPGLSFAREKGILESSFDFVLFCDDDNWLSKNYIETGFGILESNLEIGVLGGKSEAVFETKEPDWFNKVKFAYAVGKQSENSGNITKKGCVWGAAQFIRKKILLDFYVNGVKHLLTGRKEGVLLSGDDAEICKWFIFAQYKLWYSEKLLFYHFMPTSRMSLDNHHKLDEGHKLSFFYLIMYDILISVQNEFTKGILHKLKWMLKGLYRLIKDKFTTYNISEKDKYRLQFLIGCNIHILPNTEQVFKNYFIIKKIINKQK